MKKFSAVILAIAIMLSLTACGRGDKKAFEKSKEAYDNIDFAYEITDEFAGDIYEAWRLGIYEADEILSDGCVYLAKELNLSEEELFDGLAYFSLCEVSGEEWESVSEEDKNLFRANMDSIFEFFEDDLFSFCLEIVVGAYTANGKIEEVQTALDAAKTRMRELSEGYSDYEHYPNLKGYYTTTSSFFEFCCDPSGSFEQVKTTINDYRKEARDYSSDLDYIFEE